jgi:hypothetical protein
MDRAGADDHQQAVGRARDDVDCLFAAFDDGLLRILGDGDFGEEELRWDEGVLAEDCGGRSVDGRSRERITLGDGVVELWLLTAGIRRLLEVVCG